MKNTENIQTYLPISVEIQAIKFTNENKDRVFNWIHCNRYADFDSNNNPILVIQTLEGDMRANIGDYIVRGLEGEFYPCKASVFERKYRLKDSLQ